ncbi:MAG: hypothetical protein WC538_03635 [Thermoanaerobaculia bacterium]|jgi:hypothetical protein
MTSIDQTLPHGTRDAVVTPSPAYGFRSFPPAIQILVGVCVAALIAAIVLDPVRGFGNVLLWGNYFVGLGLAGMFFVAIHDLSGAGWATVFRRVPLAFTALLPLGAALILVAFVLGGDSMYPWMAGEHLQGFKALWLSTPFAQARAVVYIALWLLFARVFRRSNAISVDGVRRDARIGAMFVVVFGLTVWLSSVDWIMSLEPFWYSTMFGVYRFAGLFAAGLSAITIAVVVLRKRGAFGEAINEYHLHDLGTLLFAFCTFWMYIWFSQYMLIWYSNISEEATWFVPRTARGWGEVMALLLLVHWIIPFGVMLSARAKTNERVLIRIAGMVLFAHWLDLFIQIFGSLSPDVPPIGWWELAAMFSAVVIAVALVAARLSSEPLMPDKHPLFSESVHHHG